MSVQSVSTQGSAETVSASIPETGICAPLIKTKVAILTGGIDKPYVYGLATALSSVGMQIDLIGGDAVDCQEFHTLPNIEFLRFRHNPDKGASPITRLAGVLAYYGRLIRYAATSKAHIFHLIWNNKFEIVDRTLLMMYYRARRKRVILTVHNVNQARRDSKDTWLNRLTLRIQYRLCNHLFVHTPKMKDELIDSFKVPPDKITVIPFGINNAVPRTELTPLNAKQRLEIRPDEKAILFFGRMRPYKGLEHLLDAVDQLMKLDSGYRLIIAGEPKKGSEQYFSEIKKTVEKIDRDHRIICNLRFIPDDEIELYFKAADVLILPYKEIFQSGVMFLSFSFGLPVIATRVGSFGEEIEEGTTGFLCNSADAQDLMVTIMNFFASDLYANLDARRPQIRSIAEDRHSWDAVARITSSVYSKVL
jgi:D-inositol-3-phosphate glycosyltransferase